MKLHSRWLLVLLVLLVAACGGQETPPPQPRTPTQGPNPPSNFRAVAASPTSADLSWSAVQGATHYTLERRPASGGSFSAVGGISARPPTATPV